jgi:hypothetical protein
LEEVKRQLISAVSPSADENSKTGEFVFLPSFIGVLCLPPTSANLKKAYKPGIFAKVGKTEGPTLDQPKKEYKSSRANLPQPPRRVQRAIEVLREKIVYKFGNMSTSSMTPI